MTNSNTSVRRVKSVNFVDASLFEFATKRADEQYGGNFSSYILALVERDKSLPERLRVTSNFEDFLYSIISRFAGQAVDPDAGYDYAVPDLNIVVQAKSRFPKERKLEYAMLGSLQNAAARNPDKECILVYPDSLAQQEKERFSEISALGLSTLKVLGTSEFMALLEKKASGADDAKSQDIPAPAIV